MSVYDWEEIPDIHEVREALLKQADCKARLKVAKLELEIYQAEMSQRKPRDPSVRMIGIDEESRIRLSSLFARVLDAENELDKIDAEVKFNSHRIESAKALMYRSRI